MPWSKSIRKCTFNSVKFVCFPSFIIPGEIYVCAILSECFKEQFFCYIDIPSNQCRTRLALIGLSAGKMWVIIIFP